MSEELQKVHLYYDDINKIRVIESHVLKETEDLKDTCKDYDTSKCGVSSVCSQFTFQAVLYWYAR